jgi:AraC-like DNA-binding protein
LPTIVIIQFNRSDTKEQKTQLADRSVRVYSICINAMLDKLSAQSIHAYLQPALGEHIVTDAVGNVLAGEQRSVALLDEPNAIPLQTGRITVGYVIIPRHNQLNDQTIIFVQTIAEIIYHNHIVVRNRHLISSVSQTDMTKQIQALFAANLNLSQAAADLGVHRNTLSYQLGQASQTLGLDPRKFEDAVKLSLAINDINSSHKHS